MSEKKCELCDATTKCNLVDFESIGWRAFRNGRGKTKLFCHNHKDDCVKLIKETLLKK